jgi:hypothetical protein
MVDNLHFEHPAGDGVVRENAAPSRFLDGWFAQQFAAGNEPDYGYPKNHLSEPSIDSLEVNTIFFATKKA